MLDELAQRGGAVFLRQVGLTWAAVDVEKKISEVRGVGLLAVLVGVKAGLRNVDRMPLATQCVELLLGAQNIVVEEVPEAATGQSHSYALEPLLGQEPLQKGHDVSACLQRVDGDVAGLQVEGNLAPAVVGQRLDHISGDGVVPGVGTKIVVEELKQMRS